MTKDEQIEQERFGGEAEENDTQPEKITWYFQGWVGQQVQRQAAAANGGQR